MIFTDDADITIARFGTGDIEVASGVLDIVDETVGCLSLIPQEERPIGSKGARGDVGPDNCFDADVKVRLEFTEITSIDVVMHHLFEVKQVMLRDIAGKGELCEVCKTYVPDFEYKGCCSGHECGCMGLPIQPCACSQECFDKIISGEVKSRYAIDMSPTTNQTGTDNEF